MIRRSTLSLLRGRPVGRLSGAASERSGLGAAGDFNDLHEFDPAGPCWTNLSGSFMHGEPPPPRDLMGFAADSGGGGGRLFVFGGWSVALDGACADPSGLTLLDDDRTEIIHKKNARRDLVRLNSACHKF